MKSVGTMVSEPKEKKQSHERDKERSKSWSFNITSFHFFHAISYQLQYSFAWNYEKLCLLKMLGK
jgi:hypothetical protein